MSLSVAERERRVATFRFVEVRLMETAAAWTPTIPEMEAKVLLGRHIWDFAQHADALGRRTLELRQAAQHSLRPTEAYVQLLDEVAAVRETAERLAALYDVVLPGLESRYRWYLQETDPILDAPSVVVVERILDDVKRQRIEAHRLRNELGVPTRSAETLLQRERSLEQILAPPGAP